MHRQKSFYPRILVEVVLPTDLGNLGIRLDLLENTKFGSIIDLKSGSVSGFLQDPYPFFLFYLINHELFLRPLSIPLVKTYKKQST